MKTSRILCAAILASAAIAAPAAADPTNVGKVIITEIFANPNDNDGGGFGIGAAGDNLEFIEIFNTTNEAIDISGWYIDDEDPTAGEPFPAGTILGPRQALVIIGAQLGLRPNDNANPGLYLPQTPVWTAASFNQAFGRTVGAPNALNVLVLPGNITIANTPTLFNEIPFIVDRDGTVVDIVTYGAANFPPVTAGQSIVLRPQFLNSVDNDRGCAWQLASTDPLALVSIDTVFSFTPPGAASPTSRDRLCDAGNVCSPGLVYEVVPPPSDCNNNGIDDVVETCGATATAVDCNSNLIPDSCEPDLNGNGVPDSCDILLDREGTDRNLNNVLDSTDINLAGGTNGRGGTLDQNNNGVLDAAESWGRVIITEILVDPFASIAGGSLEWVEIQNVSTSPIDISGYRLVDIETGGDGYTLPVPAGNVLQPGEIAVLCQLPLSPSSAGGPNYTAAEMVGVYQALWGVNTPQGTPIRWIPLGNWGARATNATPSAEVLALVSGAVVRDDLVPANQSSVSGPHPTRLVGPGAIGTWVTDRGSIVDVANYSNTNSNGEPLAGWPGSDGHSSFYIVPAGGRYSVTGNNPGPNWALSIGGLNGAIKSNDLTGLPTSPFGVGNQGEDFGSPGFVPSVNQLPTGDVIISEIAATTNSIFPGSNPLPPTGQSIAAGRDEWIEIANTTGAPIDLSGWYLQDEDGRTSGFLNGTVLQPGEAAVIIGADTFVPAGTGQPGLEPLTDRDFIQEFYNTWGCGYQVITVTDWYTDNRASGLGRLADGPSFTNEIVRLVKADGTVADIVNYDDDNTPTAIASFPFGWPGDAVGGIDIFWSIYTLPGAYTQAANDSGVNWAASLTGFDGGRQNLANTQVNSSGFPTGIFNRSMFGSPGFVDGLTTGTVIIAPGFACSCRPDFNRDGNLDPDDISDYIACFFQTPPCPQGDYDRSGFTDPDDLSTYISDFFGGVCN